MNILRQMHYYQLKIKYLGLKREQPKCRDLLYKLDLHIKEKMNNDFEYKTDFIILKSEYQIRQKEIFEAHYNLVNWLRKLEGAPLTQQVTYAKFKM